MTLQLTKASKSATPGLNSWFHDRSHVQSGWHDTSRTFRENNNTTHQRTNFSKQLVSTWKRRPYPQVLKTQDATRSQELLRKARNTSLNIRASNKQHHWVWFRPGPLSWRVQRILWALHVGCGRSPSFSFQLSTHSHPAVTRLSLKRGPANGSLQQNRWSQEEAGRTTPAQGALGICPRVAGCD